jgi:Ca2+-binding RTX toxin-like protein
MHAINNSWSSESPAHNGITNQMLFQLAADGGSNIIRVPLDLSVVGPSGPPQWVVDSIGTVLQQAASLGLKVILEPGQTPPDLLPAGASLSQAPATDAGLEEMGSRFGELVEAVHSQYSQYADTVAAWEVGNEPNLSFQNDGVYYSGSGDPTASRFYVVGLDNAEAYAKFLNSASNAVQQVEVNLGQTIEVVAAGVAHNDYSYLDRMLSTLSNLGGSIDGFSIHPYTTYDYNYQSPASSRPTDWIPAEGSGAEQWDHYFSFQGAIYGVQGLLNQYGFSQSSLWLTEFGVPSYLGYRNAGAAGRIDQANWYAEAFGVLDSWGNDNLKGITAHSVLDILYKEQNDSYNGFDQDPNNDGSSLIAEGSFGLYERSSANGVISAKPVVALFDAIAAGVDFSTTDYRVISRVSTDSIDVSAWGSNGVGIVDGYVILTHDGDDSVVGSAYADSLFGGDGNDTISGNAGDDRIYGGRGNDTLSGGDGNDDIYGNHGEDLINAGANTNRVDGGTGLDTLVLDGTEFDFTVSGDGRSFVASATWQTTSAINVEQLYYTVSGVTVVLANGDTSAGNGGLTTGGGSGSIDGTSGNDILTGTAGADTINGLGGNDQIFGLDGDDAINGGVGDDVIWGGYGTNTIDGGDGFDTVIIDGPETNYTVGVSGSVVQVGGPGIWTLITNAEQLVFDDGVNPSTSVDLVALIDGSSNVITGTSSDDYLAGTSDNDEIRGLDGNDHLIGNGGDDMLLGGDGNDTLNGGAGDDVLAGGGGTYNQADYEGVHGDFSFVRNPDNSVTVTSAAWGADTLTDIDGVWFVGEAKWYDIDDLIDYNSFDTLDTGTSGDDYLTGTAGNDAILGGEGNDTLYGGAGDDLLDGQGGAYNQVDYDGAASDYTFTRNADNSITVSHATYGTDTLKNIDGVWFYGESAWYDLGTLAPDPNTYVGTGNSGYFGGTTGDDTIIFTGGTGNYVSADAGNDIIVFSGNVADYNILGQGDHFTIENAAGTDAIQFTEVEYISFGDTGPVSLADIVANSTYSPGDTWFDPEPIGGLI